MSPYNGIFCHHYALPGSRVDAALLEPMMVESPSPISVTSASFSADDICSSPSGNVMEIFAQFTTLV